MHSVCLPSSNRTTFFEDVDEVLSDVWVKELDNTVLNCKLALWLVALVFCLLCCDHDGELGFILSSVLGIVSFSQRLDSGLLINDALEERLSRQRPQYDIGHLIRLLERQKAVLLLARGRVLGAHTLQNLKRLYLRLEALGTLITLHDSGTGCRFVFSSMLFFWVIYSIICH